MAALLDGRFRKSGVAIKLFAFLVFSILFLISFSGAVRADENQSDETQYQIPSTQEECNERFNILWERSKDGDLEARYELVVHMSAYAGAAMVFPSPSFDYLANRRHLIIMSVHSTGMDFGEERNQWLDERYSDVPWLGVGSEFGKCLQKKRSVDCVQIPIKNTEVPSFEVFAEEIDLFIDAGYKAQCMGLSSKNILQEIPVKQESPK